MTDKSKTEDAAFVARALAHLPSPEVSLALQARILADFDAVAARRRRRPLALLKSWTAALKPGMPLWQPGAVLVASLVCGLIVGALAAPAHTPAATLATSADTATTGTSDTIPAFVMLGDLS